MHLLDDNVFPDLINKKRQKRIWLGKVVRKVSGLNGEVSCLTNALAIRTNQNHLGEVPNVKTPVKTNKLKNLEDLIEEEEDANKNTNSNNIDNNSVSNIDNISDLGKDLWRNGRSNQNYNETIFLAFV